MKRAKINTVIVGLAAALAAQIAVAQDAPQPSEPATPAPGAASPPAAMKSTRDLTFNQLRDATIKSESGQDLGKLDDLLIDPRTGQVRCVVLGRGGIFGFGETLVPVPWQTVTSASSKELTMNVTVQQLRGAPKLEKDYANLNSPGFLAKVDEYYSKAPAAVGGPGETPGGTEKGTGQEPGTESNK